jgi:hypothetical protein
MGRNGLCGVCEGGLVKKLAVIALCLFSSIATAKEIEEVVVVARQFRIVLISVKDTHRYNPITRSWYFYEKKASEKTEERKGRA